MSIYPKGELEIASVYHSYMFKNYEKGFESLHLKRVMFLALFPRNEFSSPASSIFTFKVSFSTTKSLSQIMPEIS